MFSIKKGEVWEVEFSLIVKLSLGKKRQKLERGYG